MVDEYELLPREELENLRHEVELLKANPLQSSEKGKTLGDSIDSLNANISKLIKVFSDVDNELVSEFEEHKSFREQLDDLSSQNSKIAEGIVLLAKLIKDNNNNNNNNSNNHNNESVFSSSSNGSSNFSHATPSSPSMIKKPILNSGNVNNNNNFNNTNSGNSNNNIFNNDINNVGNSNNNVPKTNNIGNAGVNFLNSSNQTNGFNTKFDLNLNNPVPSVNLDEKLPPFPKLDDSPNLASALPNLSSFNSQSQVPLGPPQDESQVSTPKTATTSANPFTQENVPFPSLSNSNNPSLAVPSPAEKPKKKGFFR